MKQDLCPICGGVKEESTTNFTVDYKDGVVVIRDVPATICLQCGEEYIADKVPQSLKKS